MRPEGAGESGGAGDDLLGGVEEWEGNDPSLEIDDEEGRGSGPGS